VGTDARRELMNHYNKKVRLDLFVKVKEGWRENPNDLKAFGYTG
jgi:GTP-binding protein Era